ncbi:MAG: ABC transporter permease, partial [Polyangiaceae bacterium]
SGAGCRMKFSQTVPLAARALLRNKTRSFLTMLGVIIGVASVISMVTVGEGAKAKVAGVFDAMGTNLLIVLSGSTSSGGMMGGFGSMPTLTWDDLRAIRRDARSVRAAAPVLSTKATLLSDDANWTTSVVGSSPEYFQIRALSIARGSPFSDGDVDAGSKVVVLGETVVTRLFGAGADAIGRTIRLRAVPFTVIGTLQRKGQSPMGQDYDDVALLPVSTFQAKIQGSLGKYVAGIIAVSATSPADTYRAQAQIADILRDNHRLASSTEDDFSVRNLTELASAQQQGTQALTGLLAAIAVVSLVVGGIGIMNIMLVSVTERTREIGLRMAIGATPGQVLLQFLVEAVALATTGGLLGVALGILLARLVAIRLGLPAALRLDMAAVSFGFSGLVGVVFGFYPARRASLLNPIEALRSE